MNQNTFELVALTARYPLAALGAVIVALALRGAMTDARRAARLRQLSPMTGISGELVVVRGDGRAPGGMHYPVIREGLIGSARRADVRIRHPSIRRRHAWFTLDEDGLRLRRHARAKILDDEGRAMRAITLSDGEHVTLGDVELVLVLSRPEEADPF